MMSTLFIFGIVSSFMVPASCCQAQEYKTRDGQCCPTCQEGTIVRRDCTSQSGTRCVPCEDGTYMNQPNGLTHCFSCTSCDPGNGLFEQQKCTKTSDTVCDVLTGYFCKSLEDAGCTLAERHSNCKPGQRIKEPGTNRSDTVCADCQPGYFSQDGVNCTAWTLCSESQVKVKEGSASSDVICGAASRKHYCYIYALSLTPWLVIIAIPRSSAANTSSMPQCKSSERTEGREAGGDDIPREDCADGED